MDKSRAANAIIAALSPVCFFFSRKKFHFIIITKLFRLLFEVNHYLPLLQKGQKFYKIVLLLHDSFYELIDQQLQPDRKQLNLLCISQSLSRLTSLIDKEDWFLNLKN